MVCLTLARPVHRVVLIYSSGVDTFAAHAVESFPEVAVPCFAAHFAIGYYAESGFNFSVDEAVDYSVLNCV